MRAMYIKDGQEVQSPDAQAGLYVKARDGREVKVVLAQGDLLFQFGQGAQVLTGGELPATWHSVRAPRASEEAAGVTRSNFVVFTQQSCDAMMEAPPRATVADIGVDKWQPGMTFGQFSEAVVGGNYN